MFTAIVAYVMTGISLGNPNILTLDVQNKITFVSEAACFEAVQTIMSDKLLNATLLENCRPVTGEDIINSRPDNYRSK